MTATLMRDHDDLDLMMMDFATGSQYFSLLGQPSVVPGDSETLQANRILLTPDTAKTIFDFPKRKQRNIKKNHVSDLAEKMKKGEFKSDAKLIVGVIAKSNKLNDVKECPAFLIDGQHRVNAVVMSDTEQRFDLTYRVFPSMQEMERYAINIDSGKGRNHNDQSKVAEYDKKLGLSIQESGAFQKAIRAIVRMGMDPESPFEKKDEEDREKVLDIAQYYGTATKMMFNLINYGKTNPGPFDKTISHEYKTSFRDLTILAPLIVATRRNSGFARDFLLPIVTNDQASIGVVQNTFIEVLRNKFRVLDADFRHVGLDVTKYGFRRSGDTTQWRAAMATFLCLEAFKSKRIKKFNRADLAKEALRQVDKKKAQRVEIVWPKV